MATATVTLNFDGYAPPDCNCGLQERLAAVRGVQRVSVHTMHGTAVVAYDPDLTNPGVLAEVLRRCGFACSVPAGDPPPQPMEHEAMAPAAPYMQDHGAHETMAHEHAGHAMPAMAPEPVPQGQMEHEHAGHEMPGMAPGHAPAGELEHEAMGGHHEAMIRDLRRRFWVCLVLTVPLVVFSPTIQQLLGYRLPTFPGERFVMLALATVVSIYGGWPFFQGAVRALRAGMADMDVLVSLAVLSGYLFSAASVFLFQGVDFFWEISTLVVILLLGHWMEMRAVSATGGALQELARLIPPQANLLRDGEVVTVPTAQVGAGDRLLVRPGEKIPVDGRVYEGRSEVNEALITGESRPVPKGPGDEVIGGAINGDGALRIEVTRTGQETALAQIMALVRGAQASKPRTQRLADRAAQYLTLAALGLGLVTLLFWTLVAGRPFVFALTLAITVIVIACPHALGLAIPTVTTIATTLAARSGILLRDAQAAEDARALDTVVFDKTGTLTRGEFGVTDVVPAGGWSEEQVLQAAAAVEVNSEHEIARGIVRAARERGVTVPAASGFQAIKGQGARAEVAGQEVLIGNRALLAAHGVRLPDEAQPRGTGRTWVYLAVGGQVRGSIGLADVIRPESRQAVDELRQMGLQVAMLTGDSQEVAAYVAQELGLDTFFAEVLPGDKAGRIRQLQQQGLRVGMVGDGVNDAPALVQSDVGIAIGAGTDVAIESAKVVLVRNDPRDVVKLIRLSRATVRKMRQNLLWATAYNVVAMPLAAGVLAPVGIILQPAWGALAMAASTVIVALNALLLRRLKL